METLETLFAAAAGCFMILALVVFSLALRRGARIQELLSKFSDQNKKLAESENRYKNKCRQTDEALTKLSQSKDDVSKAKRKAYLLEQKETQPESLEESDADRFQEQAFEELKKKSREYVVEIDQIKQENEKMQEQLVKLKKELSETKTLRQSQKNSGDSDRKKLIDQVKEFEQKIPAFEKKLQSAKRKARIDSQVYKVTNNKLGLAMDKIAYLEKQIKATQGAQASEEPSDLSNNPISENSEKPPPEDQGALPEKKAEVSN